MSPQINDLEEVLERGSKSLSRSWRLMEAYSIALVSGCLAAYFEQYLHPYFVPPVIGAGVVAAFAAWKLLDLDLEENPEIYPGPAAAFFAVQMLWLPVAQPVFGFAGPVLVSLGLSVSLIALARARLFNQSSLWLYLLVLPMAALLTYPLGIAFSWVFTDVIPFLQPYRVALYMISPLILVAAFAVVTCYCAWRIREDDERLIYRFLPAMTAVLFAVVFPMYEADGTGWWAYLTWGNAAEWLFVVFVFWLGISENSGRLVRSTVPLAVAYCGLFILFNAVEPLQQMMVAQSLNVREPAKLPLSTDKPRIMPFGIGESRCLEGNAESATHSGAVSFTMEAKGINYQCALHFDGFVAGDGLKRGLISMIPGATYKIMRVESTNTSGAMTPVESIFPLGENTRVLRSAVLARHPGGALGEFTYSKHEEHTGLVYSYTTARLFWFTMVPTLGGAVVENEKGLLEDYTVTQAAEQFPGAFQMPAQLVRDRAHAWAHYRLQAWWPFRQEKELSEPAETLAGLSAEKRKLFGNNTVPYAIPTVAGPKYWILLEPYGKEGTAGSDVLLFDARYPGLIERKDTTSGRVVKGLRDVVNQAPAVVPGNFELRGSEVYLHITEKDMYFIVPLLDGNAKFIGAAILRSDEYIVFAGAVPTSAEVVQHIREFEKTH